jgi:hypothetical protein
MYTVQETLSNNTGVFAPILFHRKPLFRGFVERKIVNAIMALIMKGTAQCLCATMFLSTVFFDR